MGWLHLVRIGLTLSTAVLGLYFVVSFFRAYRRVDLNAVDAVGWVCAVTFSEINLLLLASFRTDSDDWTPHELTFSLVTQSILFTLIVIRVLRWNRLKHQASEEEGAQDVRL